MDRYSVGAYLLECVKDAQLILVATGSEVSLAVETAQSLAKEGIKVRFRIERGRISSQWDKEKRRQERFTRLSPF